MDALRRNLRELKSFLVKVPFIKTMLAQAKYIFAIGASTWLLGGLLPDTAYFAVSFFSSIGRVVMFIGLFLTLVKGEDRFIMTMSTIISVGSLIIIIIEIAAVSYLGNFESYLFAIIFGGLAINTSKYLNNQWYEEQEKKDDATDAASDYLSPTESDSSIKIETLSHKDPYGLEIPEQPVTSYDEPEIPLQKASPTQETPAQPMDYYDEPEMPLQEAVPTQETSVQPIGYYAQPEILTEETSTVQEISTVSTKAKVQRQITVSPTKTTNSRLSDIKRAPSIGSAPSIGRAPSVSIKPKE